MSKKTLAITIIILAVVGTAAAYFLLDKDEPAQSVSPSPSPGSTLPEGAKSFNSAKLGISFQFREYPHPDFRVTTNEKDNMIYIHDDKDSFQSGKTIEVFEKNASQSLKEAIEERFLKNYSKDKCFVMLEPSGSYPSSYTVAHIAFPEPTDKNLPWWDNSKNCPLDYSDTNAVQYFLMNRDVPGKYIFLKLGQDSITDDGNPPMADGSRGDWSASIRINK